MATGGRSVVVENWALFEHDELGLDLLGIEVAVNGPPGRDVRPRNDTVGTGMACALPQMPARQRRHGRQETRSGSAVRTLLARSVSVAMKRTRRMS